MINFTDMDLPDEVIASLQRIDIESPTEIQQKSIPPALLGNDILASSQTGSGKTLAYLLPAIARLLKSNEKALILTPTRELAIQVHSVLHQIIKKMPLSSAVIVGGEPFFKQTIHLKKNPNVVIGTPGRIFDHISRKVLSLSSFTFLVLDEMDRMLDMGMKEQIDEIHAHMPKERQTLLFSATIPEHISRLTGQYLNQPELISVGSKTQPAPEIEQEFLYVNTEKKFQELENQLGSKEGTAIVFVKTKKGADELARQLKRNQHRADAIHGDLNQSRRSRVIAGFRNQRTRILVATDVAARGLDIDHVQFVFNYDLPLCAQDYLHRIGRTGRAGAKGQAISFVSTEDKRHLRAIKRLVEQGEETPFDYRQERPGRRSRSQPGRGQGAGRRRFDSSSWMEGRKESSFKRRKGRKQWEKGSR